MLPAFGPAAAVPLALIFFWDGLLVPILLPAFWAIGGRDRSRLVAIAGRAGRSIIGQPAFLAVAIGARMATLDLELPTGIRQAAELLGSAAPALGLASAFRWPPTGGPMTPCSNCDGRCRYRRN